jgi:hypothetical protein
MVRFAIPFIENINKPCFVVDSFQQVLLFSIFPEFSQSRGMSNARRIRITAFDVVNGQGDARGFTVFGGDGLTQVGGKRGNAALARQIVTDERNAADP